ncbi:MAG: group 1 truncated hemoglobin [Burkholderiales bacterium]|nr:MAG: group 1 truncated hemoglobin [Burkholderiales bacterium]
MRTVVIAMIAILTCPSFAQPSPPVNIPPGEEAVDPYVSSNANAGSSPFAGTEMLQAFHGVEGIDRIVEDLVEVVQEDARISKIFKASDFVRLRRTLKEQFCYLLNGGCDYTGRDMRKMHEDHGVTVAEFNAMVELLQDAMNREGVAFSAQNRFLAKLAPMKRDIVTR